MVELAAELLGPFLQIVELDDQGLVPLIDHKNLLAAHGHAEQALGVDPHQKEGIGVHIHGDGIDELAFPLAVSFRQVDVVVEDVLEVVVSAAVGGLEFEQGIAVRGVNAPHRHLPAPVYSASYELHLRTEFVGLVHQHLPRLLYQHHSLAFALHVLHLPLLAVDCLFFAFRLRD